jgi:hypothetical protein
MATWQYAWLTDQPYTTIGFSHPQPGLAADLAGVLGAGVFTAQSSEWSISLDRSRVNLGYVSGLMGDRGWEMFSVETRLQPGAMTPAQLQTNWYFKKQGADRPTAAAMSTGAAMAPAMSSGPQMGGPSMGGPSMGSPMSSSMPDAAPAVQPAPAMPQMSAAPTMQAAPTMVSAMQSAPAMSSAPEMAPAAPTVMSAPEMAPAAPPAPQMPAAPAMPAAPPGPEQAPMSGMGTPPPGPSQG